MGAPTQAPGGTVLVVSDDLDVAEEARFGLASDVEAQLATDAREALEMLASLNPVAAIVDLMTGSAGGFALARDMSQSARLAEIPIVMLIDRDQDEWLARQAGARITLRKPLGPGELGRALASVLP